MPDARYVATRAVRTGHGTGLQTHHIADDRNYFERRPLVTGAHHHPSSIHLSLNHHSRSFQGLHGECQSSGSSIPQK